MNQRPSCFGLASVVDSRNPVCRLCQHVTPCLEAVYSSLVRFKGVIDVRDTLAAVERDLVGRATGEPLHSVAPTLAGAAPALLHTTIAIPARTTKVEKVKFGLTDTDKAQINAMPKKVALKLKRLLELNLDKLARVELAAGRNPFPRDGAGYLHVAADLLLRGGFTKASLRVALMERLAWSEGTAFSHVSAVVHLFPALEIAIEQDDSFVLPPSLGGQDR